MTKWLKRFWRNTRAVTSGEVIGLAVSFFIVAIMAPIAIGTIANISSAAQNQTVNWDASVLTIFQVVLPIIWVVAVALYYLPGRE